VVDRHEPAHPVVDVSVFGGVAFLIAAAVDHPRLSMLMRQAVISEWKFFLDRTDH
jgi:hypothetical protein